MKKRILTVSSSNMDLVLGMSRIPSAGETLKECRAGYASVPGGKGANAALTVARLGASSVFCTRLGNDRNGEELKTFYEKSGIDTRFVFTDTSASTGLAAIMVESNGRNRIVVYPGANERLCDEDVESAFMCYPDALFLNFEIPMQTVLTACRYAQKQEIPIIVDAGPADSTIRLEELPPIEIFSPNESETYALTGIEPAGMESCLRAASKLYERLNTKYVVIKLGDRGAFIYDGIHYNVIPSYEVTAVDTTAAGDAFTAALSLEYIRGAGIVNACKYANAVGAVVVSRKGASSSIPTSNEVDAFIREHELV